MQDVHFLDKLQKMIKNRLETSQIHGPNVSNGFKPIL